MFPTKMHFNKLYRLWIYQSGEDYFHHLLHVFFIPCLLVTVCDFTTIYWQAFCCYQRAECLSAWVAVKYAINWPEGIFTQSWHGSLCVTLYCSLEHIVLPSFRLSMCSWVCYAVISTNTEKKWFLCVWALFLNIGAYFYVWGHLSPTAGLGLHRGLYMLFRASSATRTE